MSSGAAPKQVRLILGLDFGTTFSALCFATSNTTDIREIHTFTAWPGSCEQHGEHNVKTPTRIAYASENPGSDEDDGLVTDATGYEVEPGYRSYSWFKLLLDESAFAAEYDDPELKLSRSEGLMRLPGDKSAKDVTTDYLRGLYKICQERLNRKFGHGRFASQLRYPMDVWLTVPATWSDKAKLLTQTAAKDAGFGSHAGDRIFLIPEPEAAALAALKSTLLQVDDLIQAGDNVLICDCGGGTVDITTYNIVTTTPTLELRELLEGSGAKFGSTAIDRNLYKLMIQRFGEAFKSLDDSHTGPGSQLMSSFENIKKDFSLKRAKKRPNRIILKMRDVPADAMAKRYYDTEYDSVLLNTDDMKGLFDPVIEKTCALLKGQITKAEEDLKGKKMKVVLVGGFASSPYLWEKLEVFLENQNAILTAPMRNASADSPPETIESTDIEKIGIIKYTLEDLDTSQLCSKIGPDGVRQYQARLTLVIRMGDAAGLLNFKIFCQGSEVGTAQLDISTD